MAHPLRDVPRWTGRLRAVTQRRRVRPIPATPQTTRTAPAASRTIGAGDAEVDVDVGDLVADDGRRDQGEDQAPDDGRHGRAAGAGSARAGRPRSAAGSAVRRSARRARGLGRLAVGRPARSAAGSTGSGGSPRLDLLVGSGRSVCSVMAISSRCSSVIGTPRRCAPGSRPGRPWRPRRSGPGPWPRTGPRRPVARRTPGVAAEVARPDDAARWRGSGRSCRRPDAPGRRRRTTRPGPGHRRVRRWSAEPMPTETGMWAGDVGRASWAGSSSRRSSGASPMPRP